MKILNASDFEQKQSEWAIAKLRQLATVDRAAYVSSKRLDPRVDTGRSLGAKLNHCFVYSTLSSYYKSTGNEAIVEPERKWYSRKHILHHKHEQLVMHSNPVEL